MARRLVSEAEVIAYLGIAESAWSSALDHLRIATIGLFERLCDRAQAPFSDAITARTESHDGTGGPELWLDYPVGALTSLKIGRSVATPDETLSVGDVDVLSVATGDRRLVRVDGGIFGDLDVPRIVHATYDTAADLPEDAQLAVLRVIAQVYRQRGSEDATSENVSGYARTMANLAAQDAIWLAAVAAHKRGVFR